MCDHIKAYLRIDRRTEKHMVLSSLGLFYVWRFPFLHLSYLKRVLLIEEIYFLVSVQLDLRVLRACRQLYSECNYVVWTTNKFSLRRAYVFRKFMNARAPVHLKLLRRLHISVENRLGDPESWDSCFNMKLIRSLEGLRELTIGCAYYSDPTFVPKFLANEVNTFIISILRFRVLALTKAKIFLYERKFYSASEGFWTIEDRRKVADHAVKLLLDPEGAKKFLQERAKWFATPSTERQQGYWKFI